MKLWYGYYQSRKVGPIVLTHSTRGSSNDLGITTPTYIRNIDHTIHPKLRTWCIDTWHMISQRAKWTKTKWDVFANWLAVLCAQPQIGAAGFVATSYLAKKEDETPLVTSSWCFVWNSWLGDTFWKHWTNNFCPIVKSASKIKLQSNKVYIYIRMHTAMHTNKRTYIWHTWKMNQND